MKSFGWLRLLPFISTFMRYTKGSTAITIGTIIASIITVILMSRANIVDVEQFHKDLKNLYDFLQGNPLLDPTIW